jgi:uncharacterized protein YjbI with pentapeptide repeats
LSRIDLDKFDLSHANFDDADLSDAFLIETILSNASFCRANLRRAFLIGSQPHSANFAGADLTQAYLRNIMPGGINFSFAKLVHADCEWSKLDRSDFRGADLTNARLYGTTMGGSHLEGVDLRVTLGLYDILAGGSYVDEHTVMPGKDAAAAGSEMTTKSQYWKPIKHPDGSITY